MLFRSLIEKNKKYLLSRAGITATKIISKKHFESITLFTPFSLSEQTAIAQVLSDMDREIEALKRKRKKYQQLKKAMMQQLLTGKIRLL